MIGLRSLTTGRLRPMEFMIDGTLREIPLPVIMSVTGPESYLATARLGLGLVQVPRFHAEADLANGTLVAGAVELPAAFGAGIAALSAQPPALAARSRVHRLCDAGIRAAPDRWRRSPGLFGLPSPCARRR